jgi:hypothetical protein
LPDRGGAPLGLLRPGASAVITARRGMQRRETSGNDAPACPLAPILPWTDGGRMQQQK